MGHSGTDLLASIGGLQTRAKIRPCGCSIQTSLELMLGVLWFDMPIAFFNGFALELYADRTIRLDVADA